MQTFLPYQSFSASAACLDSRRLGKQRVEVLQILRAISGLSDGWKSHPAVKMWQDYGYRLTEYGLAICTEWLRRGYRDSCTDKIREIGGDFPICPPPPWLTDDFCLSHQSNLIRKLPSHYRPIFGPDVPDDLPYIWPV